MTRRVCRVPHSDQRCSIDRDGRWQMALPPAHVRLRIIIGAGCDELSGQTLTYRLVCIQRSGFRDPSARALTTDAAGKPSGAEHDAKTGARKAIT